MKKTEAESIIIALLFSGFIAGIFAHIQLTTGYDLSSNESIALTALNITCKAFSTLPIGASSCYQTYEVANSYVALVDLVSFLATISSLTVIILQFLDDPVKAFIIGIIFGVILYFIAYNVGFTLMGGPIPTTTTSTSTTSTSTTSTTTSSTTSSTSIIPRYSYCKASSGQPFNCTDPSVSNGLLSFNLTATGNRTFYDVNLWCSNSISSIPFASQLYPLEANGTLNLSKDNYGISISGDTVQPVFGLSCNIDLTNGTLTNWTLWTYYLASPPPASQNNQFYHATPQIYYNVTTPP